MTIYKYPSEKKPNINESVLALGFFDGVHLAHRDLLSRAAEEARREGLDFGIFTFASDGGIKIGANRLYDDSQKTSIFEALGADFAVFADFGAIAGSSPENFVKKILCEDLKCKICVAGFNFRFGKGASGNSEMLKELMAECGGRALIREEITAQGVTLSASLIRSLISDGKIEQTNSLLGAPYHIKGKVSEGRKDGRRLGFPTINIIIEEGRVVPKFGVYRTALVIDGRIYTGVSNVGVCPTFGGEQIRLETHIVGFDGNLYGEEICVYLLGFLREERRFDSLNELKMQINIDKITTIKENGDITWQHLGLK